MKRGDENRRNRDKDAGNKRSKTRGMRKYQLADVLTIMGADGQAIFDTFFAKQEKTAQQMGESGIWAADRYLLSLIDKNHFIFIIKFACKKTTH